MMVRAHIQGDKGRPYMIIDSNILGHIEHLHIGDFALDLGESSIVWAANGVGKTSIYKYLRDENGGELAFVDCEDYRNNFLKQKRKIQFGADIAPLKKTQDDLSSLIGEFDIDGALKSFNLTTIAAIKNALPTKTECKKNKEDTILSFSAEKVNEISQEASTEDLRFLIKHVAEIRNASEIKDDIEQIKNSSLESIMRDVERILTDEDDTCPICGSKVEGIKAEINKRRQQLHTKKTPLVEEYLRENPDLSLNSAVEKVDFLIDSFGDADKVTDDHVLSVIISLGSKESLEELQSKQVKVKDLKKSIAKLEAERDKFFSLLLGRKDQIKDFFQLKYSVDPDKVVFDSDAGAVEISLPRDVATFSTGEIDLMILNIGINAYLASDATSLIIDDPISSFDISNQYVVMFDLVRIAIEEKRPVVIFTHNMNCINIADSQSPKAFKYFYLEKSQRGLELLALGLTRPSNSRRISPESIVKNAMASANEDIGERIVYLNALISRSPNENLSKLFHYDGSYETCYEDRTLSNDYLVELIDKCLYSDNDGLSFAERCINKMLCFAGCRVWVEKQIFLGIPEEKKAELEGLQLGEKIDAVFPRNADSIWIGSEAINRPYLFSKKTMINQQLHPDAQGMPFEFAINLSEHDICSEVDEIVGRFNMKQD